MKKIIFSLLFAAAGLAFVNTVKAQGNVEVNISIGAQPEWGPAGYDYAEYYYMPAIETYYYVPRNQFVYFSGNRWVFSSNLPPRYANYDLYSGYKIVLRPNDSYRQFNDHRIRYARYKNYANRQVIICNKQGNHCGKYKNKDKHGKGHGKGRH